MPNEIQSHICGVKENTQFPDLKEKPIVEKWEDELEQHLLDAAKVFQARKAVRRCGMRIRVKVVYLPSEKT